MAAALGIKENDHGNVVLSWSHTIRLSSECGIVSNSLAFETLQAPVPPVARTEILVFDRYDIETAGFRYFQTSITLVDACSKRCHRLSFKPPKNQKARAEQA